MYTQIIETPLLRLRPMSPADAPACFVWCADPAVNRFMTYPIYTEVEEVRAWLVRMEADPGVMLCGIERIADGLLIGSISLSHKPDTTALNLGYNLRRDCWGQGYATPPRPPAPCSPTPVRWACRTSSPATPSTMSAAKRC